MAVIYQVFWSNPDRGIHLKEIQVKVNNSSCTYENDHNIEKHQL